MLSRIANSLYVMGRAVERVQSVTRILEVNHKMHLEHLAGSNAAIWQAIAHSFLCPIEDYSEEELYRVLVCSDSHPYSVRRCLREARDEGRSMRDHISDEMWLHLNRSYLEYKDVDFQKVIEIGRSEFNRRIEVFCDALYGLADDTMIHGEAWAFFKMGKYMKRALMLCRILHVKRAAISPSLNGAPADVYHWQALLRSVSGYEPYRRAHDARIVPERVLEFVLQNKQFPRSLAYALGEMRGCLPFLVSKSPLERHLDQLLKDLLDRLRTIEISRAIHADFFGGEISYLNEVCLEIADMVELAFFTSLRPASMTLTSLPGAALKSQQ